MIKEGQNKKARYWGKFKVKKVVKLANAVICNSKEVGIAEFMPTIVKIEWENSPSEDNNEFWFPYWIKIGGKEKYGQYAPMIGKKALLHLLEAAINEDFFDEDFLKKLSNILKNRLEN
jgi:hypothetical protein